MNRSIQARRCACAVFLVPLFLGLFCPRPSFAATTTQSIFDIKTIEEPEVTPYCEFGEPGHDPFGRIGTLSASGSGTSRVPSGTNRQTVMPVQEAGDMKIELIDLLRLLYINGFGILRL